MTSDAFEFIISAASRGVAHLPSEPPAALWAKLEIFHRRIAAGTSLRCPALYGNEMFGQDFHILAPGNALPNLHFQLKKTPAAAGFHKIPPVPLQDWNEEEQQGAVGHEHPIPAIGSACFTNHHAAIFKILPAVSHANHEKHVFPSFPDCDKGRRYMHRRPLARDSQNSGSYHAGISS